jgi:hypothetical protein
MLLMRAKQDYWILKAYTMKVKIHEIAAQELDEASEWYEIQSKGLGKRFKKSVTDQLQTSKCPKDSFFDM